MLSQFVRDVRHSVRGLSKVPVFTLTAVTTLGLGIAATTLMFSVVNGVLLRPLPYDDSGRLVNIWHDLVNERQFLPAVNPADFRDYQEKAASFEDVAAGTGERVVGLSGVLTGEGAPRRVALSAVSHNFFSLLGVDPVLGRHFTPEEEEFGGPKVALLGYELWRDRYGADRALVGNTIQLDGESFAVVGVLPEGFSLLLPAEAFLIRDADLWVPLQLDYGDLRPRNWTNLTVLARLEKGVELSTAQAEMDVMAQHFRDTYPGHSQAGTQIRLVPYRQDIIKHAGPSIWMLFGAVGFVLLIACANVAHLLLVRGSTRARELAVRAAVGAGRPAIARQMLAESLVLGLFGLALGLLVALGGLRALSVLQPPNLPRLGEIQIDASVLAFSAFASILTAVLFGLAPAYHASRTDLIAALREGGRTGPGMGQARLRNLLIVAEVGFSIVLLVGMGLMIRSFAALERVRPGFDPKGALTFGLALPNTDYAEGPERMAFFDRLREGLLALPGVTAVGGVSQLPLTGSGPLWPYAADQESASRGDTTGDGRIVSVDYFEALGTKLVAGRYFRQEDDQDGRPVVIIDPMLAARAFPGQDPSARTCLSRSTRTARRPPSSVSSSTPGSTTSGGMSAPTSTDPIRRCRRAG